MKGRAAMENTKGNMPKCKYLSNDYMWCDFFGEDIYDAILQDCTPDCTMFEPDGDKMFEY